MYTDYYGLVEKPFGLTTDLKYLYRSKSVARAIDVVYDAIERRESFVVITGDVGTGKTLLCKALLAEPAKKTFPALCLNPCLGEEELLISILEQIGLLSRNVPTGVLPAHQDLSNTVWDFFFSLMPLDARTVLIIDEAQDLPVHILEQILAFSNHQTEEQLLQTVLVGQPDLMAVFRSPEFKQLDQRVSTNHRLSRLEASEIAPYVAHRLGVASASGAAAVSFTPGALRLVCRRSHGVPRLVNLLCDRALLAGYLAQSSQITRKIVAAAAAELKEADGRAWLRRFRRLN